MKQAIILAGGFGTRLNKAFPGIPKPMVPFFDKPLLEHQLILCKKYGFDDIKILLHHKGEVISEYFGDGSQLGLKIDYFDEEYPLGTAGAVLNIFHHLDENFLVIYGDTYLNVDLDRFFKNHIEKRVGATLFVHPNNHPHDSDLVELDQASFVKALHSYPHPNDVWYRNLVNAALFAFNKESLSSFSDLKTPQDLSKDLLPKMLSRGKKIFGYESTEYIKDMGTPERIASVNKDIENKKHIRLEYSAKKNAVFFDRDGVINIERGLISDLEKFELIEGVSSAIKKVNDAGILVIIVTNQPVISRGDITPDGLKKIHNKMETLLGEDGAYIDRIYFCPHHPDKGFKGEIPELKIKCECRKPSPGMILKAEKDLNIDLEKSWLIGDSTTDIKTAEDVGIKSILMTSGLGGKDKKFEVNADYIFDDLNQAVDFILRGA